jgi:hypothetical protein
VNEGSGNFMKKSMVMGCVALFSANIYAGSTCKPLCEPMCFLPCQMYFLQLEGGYSWNTLKGVDINIMDVGNIRSNSNKDGWSGRVAIGLGKKVYDPLYITSEIGWGYYGSSTLSLGLAGAPADAPNFNGIRFKSMQDGFDVLAGILYNQPYYELFLKAGALIQNSQTDINADIGALLNGNLNGNVSLSINQTEVLPEIKIGGAYHITRNFAITAAWMHAFGSDTKVSANIDPNNPSGSINIDLKNPSLDTATLGLQYRFA